MKLPYWRLSSFYFFYFAALGSILPYWSLYLEHLGFSALEIGELNAFLVMTKIVAPTIWGWLVDRTAKNLRVIRIAAFFSAFCFSGLFIDHHYFWIAWVTVCFSFFWHAVLPQFEVATLFHLKNDSHRYSQIRLWGSIGFICTVIGIGRFLDYFSIDWLPGFIVSLLAMIWLATVFTPDVGAAGNREATGGIGPILRKPEVIAFFIVYILLQLAHGPYYVFYSLYLSHYNYSTAAIGLLWALGVCAEIVLFLFMKKILRRVSLRSVLLWSILLSCTRWWLIAYFPQTFSVVLSAQLLHAATYGSAHVAAIHLVHEYFGQRHQGMGQALYSSVCFGIGGVLGSLYSGFFWESLGAQFVFAMAAASCCIAFLIAFFGVGRKKALSIG